MDIKEYLSRKKSNLDDSSKRIKEFQVFDFNYIPSKPLMRDEAKPVIDAILRYQRTAIANNVLILGSRGSGKSVMARYLMNIMRHDLNLHFLYVNCRQHNTSYKILAQLLGVSARGLSMDELWQRFTHTFKARTVVVLDEVDLISERDKNKDLLYLLSRSLNNYMTILLSNKPRFAGTLDESICSSLQPEIIHFRSYNALEIASILTDRANIGLRFTPSKIISKIAAMTVKNTNSDVRVAIKTLYLWALEPKTPLKEHFDKARKDIIYDIIKDLNDKNLLILKAVSNSNAGFVKDIYRAYKKISVRYGEEPFSYMHFYSNLSYMQSLGLVLLVSAKIDRTFTNRIQLTFDGSVLENIWKFRFG